MHFLFSPPLSCYVKGKKIKEEKIPHHKALNNLHSVPFLEKGMLCVSLILLHSCDKKWWKLHVNMFAEKEWWLYFRKLSKQLLCEMYKGGTETKTRLSVRGHLVFFHLSLSFIMWYFRVKFNTITVSYFSFMFLFQPTWDMADWDSFENLKAALKLSPHKCAYVHNSFA